MKIKLLPLLLLLLALAANNKARAQLFCDSVFSKEYISTEHIQPFVVKQLGNNEMLVIGRASLSQAGNFQLMAIRLSASGNIKWSTMLGGTDADTLKGIIELSDNSLLLYGIACSFGHSNGKILLLRLSANGNLLWSRQIGFAGNTKDIIKDIHQTIDGDLIGTFNTNDSTSLSDPVVFKMGLDGTVRWAKKFDTGNDDSFTSIAESGNKIYVGGYANTNRKKAVLVTLQEANGSLLTSQSPSYFDTTYRQEIADLEVYNSRISYGLWSKKGIGSNTIIKLHLYQSGLQGQQVSQRVISFSTNDVNPVTGTLKRSKENGFFIRHLLGNAPTVVKLSPFFNINWSTQQAQLPYYFNVKGNGFDISQSDGAISATWYRSFSTNNIDRMVISKTSVGGITGNCTQAGNTFFIDTGTVQHNAFTWATIADATITLNEPISLAEDVLSLNQSPVCDTIFCTDITPLPLACNQTSLVEYSGRGTSNFRDAVTMNDGGQIAVGELGNQGFITRIGNNGDILWSKQYDKIGHQAIFMRVLKTDGNNVYAFANNYYAVDHGASRSIKMLKLDADGNVLLSKVLSSGSNYFEIGDICTTPDGGFIIVINWGWGIGYLYSYVLRFSAGLNIIWQKEIKHNAATPVFRSITCDGAAVYIGHDSYDQYNQNKIGIQKLNYSTGNDVWSKGYTIDATALRFSKIIAINDTVYAFIKRYKQIDFNNYDLKVAVLKVEQGGNMLFSKIVETDNLAWPTSFGTEYHDFANPDVTYMADSNFVLSHPAKYGSATTLNLSKLDRNGNSIWSRNYTQLNGAIVRYVKSHDSSIVITGSILRPQPNFPGFKNSFILKANNQGKILATVSGICLPEDRPITTSPIAVTEVPSRVDSVVNINYFSLTDDNIVIGPISFDATLYCNQVAFCSTVRLTGDSSSCNLADTLRFYPLNNNCGAVIRLRYDTSFFLHHSIARDTIKLLPRHPGLSVIYADIESPCMDTTQTLQVSVLISASSINVGADTSLCPGTSIHLRAGPGYRQYLWNDGSNDSTLLVTQPGRYWVEVSDYCGQSFRDSITILPYNSTVDLGPDKIKCNADTLILNAPAGFIRYEWSNNYNISSLTGQQVLVYPLLDTAYYLRAEKLPGCFSYDTIRVQANTSPPINLGPDKSFCTGDSLVLNAGSGFTQYSWSNGASTQQLTAFTTGTYSVLGITSDGCKSYDTLKVLSLYPLPVVNLGNDPVICVGTPRLLQAGTYPQYLWNTGQTSNSISVINTGLYSVTVTDNNGCKGNGSLVISRLVNPPTAFLPADTAICNYGSMTLVPLRNFSSYWWNTNAATPQLTINAPGTYWLQVKDSYNCTGTDSIIVSSKECIKGLFVPSGFTPNNDGKNDVLAPLLFGNVVSYHFTIYNRWGQPVFQSVKVGEGWNGKVKGMPTDTHVFVWQCRYQLQGEAVQQAKGTVTLIR